MCNPRFIDMQGRNTVLLATTGGFTNRAAQPEGFTTEDGNIVNAVMMRDRHGLVLMRGGGIQVLNLKNPNFTLPMGGPVITNPLDNLLAYAQLVAWTKRSHATLFQTQLLAFSDRITIDEKRAPAKLAERRVLALASDRSNGQVEHVIINLPSPQYLADVAKEVYALLAARKKKVEAVLNLDVGSYNILNVYDASGAQVNSVRGPVDIRRATNLIVYTK